MSRIVLSIVMLLVLVPSYSGMPRLELFGRGPVQITATPVPLIADRPGERRLGQLRYLGGFSLTSPNPAFGGFSTMIADGSRLLLLNDGGGWARFNIDAAGRNSAVRFGDLGRGPGTGWEKRDRDSESMTIDRATGRIWVGFENSNELWRYDRRLRAERRAAPPAMAKWPDTGGPEAMERLADGRFLVLSESARKPGQPGREAILFDGDPTLAPRAGFRFRFVPPKGFRPTEVRELPDGRLLVLTRRARVRDQFTAALLLVDRGTIRPGAVVRGREIARFAPPVLHDNFEAMAVTHEAGRLILWIVSDDNFELFQRTLLLKFAIDL